MKNLIKEILYNKLRKGSKLGLLLYYCAGIGYWLIKARRLYIGTRVVEIPWAIDFIKMLPDDSHILQLGDVLLYENDMTRHFESVVDLDADEETNDRLHVYKNNIVDVDIPNNSFNYVISISTIEHVGLWGCKFVNGDAKAIKKIYNLLRDGGLLLFTVPFGYYSVNDNFRIYDSEKILELLRNLFEIICAEYIMWNGWRWVSVPPNVAEKMYILDNNKNMNCGAALVIARKINSFERIA